MHIAMPYGSEMLEARLDGVELLGTLDIAETPALPDVNAALGEALARPIGPCRFDEPWRPDERATIVVSDSFRHTGSEWFLPPLIEHLNRRGVRDESISFLFATGTHRAPTEAERARILSPELYERFRDRAFAHDAHDRANLLFLGTTSRGTPVWINRRAVETDRLIVTGSIVLHYFGGFGGGRKAVVPGLAGVETISHNHAMNLDPHEDILNPDVRIGVLDGNPVAEDMLEAARHVKVDLLVNTVLNREGQIAAIFAGDLDAAHRAGCAVARHLFATPISAQADLVIASSGGARNFVQSHKALYNAFQAMKPGGHIVFACRCEEGLGGEQFVKWLRLGSREAVIAGLRKQSEINGQTALSTLEKAPHATLLTMLGEAEVSLMRGRRGTSLQEAVDAYMAESSRTTAYPSVYLMPSASYTAPVVL